MNYRNRKDAALILTVNSKEVTEMVISVQIRTKKMLLLNGGNYSKIFKVFPTAPALNHLSNFLIEFPWVTKNNQAKPKWTKSRKTPKLSPFPLKTTIFLSLTKTAKDQKINWYAWRRQMIPLCCLTLNKIILVTDSKPKAKNFLCISNFYCNVSSPKSRLIIKMSIRCFM